MPNLNKVMLMGNLTRDPEVRYTPKGTAVTDIGLAVNRNYTLDDGERREETTFVDVTFWGRQAEVLGEYMKKGRPLYVEGRLNLDTWEDKQSGQQRSRLKVIGDGFQFLGGRDEGAGGGQQSHGGGGQSQPQVQQNYGGGGQAQQNYSGGGQSQPQQNYQPQSSPPPQQQQSAPPPQQEQRPPAEEEDDIPF